MDTQPETEIKPQARVRSKPQEKKVLRLNIPEKLFILTIDDNQNTVSDMVKSTLCYGLAGGMLAELALAGKIQLEDKRVALADSAPTGEALFDDLLTMIATEKKARKLSRWVDTIGNKHTVKLVAEQLAERNVIAIEKKQYLWIIPYEVYPQIDASAKYWVKQQLRGIVLVHVGINRWSIMR